MTAGTVPVAAASVGQALARARGVLADRGIATAALDARVLLAHVIGAEPALLPGRRDEPLGPADARRFEALLARRARREPIAHLTGEREFWSLRFEVTADVLVPRPDSETVVAAALDWVGDRGRAVSILDLGTGSGCLLLALLAELGNARGVGVDSSAAALAVARRNAEALGLDARARFCRGDWGQGLAAPFDVIVANPPYIAAGDADLAPEVRDFEPPEALFAGADGLAAFRRLIPDAARLTAPTGAIFLEIGRGQAPAVSAIARASCLQVIDIKEDISGIARCVVAGRGPA